MAIRLEMTEAFVDPSWFRMAKYGGSAMVDAEGFVVLREKRLRFANPEEALPPGTWVEVSCPRNFECVSRAEQQAKQAAWEKQREVEREAERDKKNARRDTALALNSSLTIGVPWEPDIKDVLSGLSFNSSGNGYNKATVQHIRLLAELETGRIKRKKGDFLCTAASGSNGKNWANGEPVRFADGDGNSYLAPITCKQCLALAKRLAGIK
jgi:hypothetical protein